MKFDKTANGRLCFGDFRLRFPDKWPKRSIIVIVYVSSQLDADGQEGEARKALGLAPNDMLKFERYGRRTRYAEVCSIWHEAMPKVAENSIQVPHYFRVRIRPITKSEYDRA